MKRASILFTLCLLIGCGCPKIKPQPLPHGPVPALAIESDKSDKPITTGATRRTKYE